MPHLLSPLLSRWEIDPPAITAPEANRRLKDAFSILQAGGLVRATTEAGSVDCPDCSRRCRVEYIADASGAHRGYINCRDCGLAEVPSNMLQRWEIDTPALLASIFADAKLAIEPQAPPHLWQVGKASWAGRSRQILFARSFRSGRCDQAIDVLERHKMAVVFAPTDAGATRWHQAAGNLVIPLNAVVSLEGDRLSLDVEDIEGRIMDAGMGPSTQKKRSTKKRADMAAKIEALTAEVVKFLVAARDHAFDTMERTGEPKLLKRPSKKKFCELAGLEAYDFSRCHDDEEARELRIYWEITEDLDQIMKFKGPISGGRRT